MEEQIEENNQWIHRSQSLERTLEEESKYFNEKFPKTDKWLEVTIREASPNSGEKADVIRFEMIARVVNDASNAPNSTDEMFVCYYDEGDPDRRARAEDLLMKIYPLFENPILDIQKK